MVYEKVREFEGTRVRLDKPPFLYTCNELSVYVHEGTSYFVGESDISVT